MARSRPLARLLALAAVLAALGAGGAGLRADEAAPGTAARAAEGTAEALFGLEAPVPVLDLVLEPAERARLREDPRTYVPARLVEQGGATLERVGLRLKGAAGSFQGVDERPSFTLDTDRFVKGQRWHGLERVHLNSSVQDESLLCEALGTDLFHAAGLLAPRVGHARVRLDGRELGVMVVKEGVDRRFLVRTLGSDEGNLYDGGFCEDLDGELEKDAGRGPEDRRDLQALVAAARTPDLTLREAALAPLLDLDRFLAFVALERMLGHWDGYAGNRNNYRVAMRPGDGRALFLPHGMDQLFGDAGASVLDDPVGLLAEGALAVPALRVRYRLALLRLLPLLDAPTSLLPRLEARLARLSAAVATLGPEAAAAHAAQVAALRERLVARGAFLATHVREPDPPQPEVTAAGLPLAEGWRAQVDSGEPALEEVEHAGRRALALACTPGEEPCTASWRRRLTLPRGRYALVGALATSGVRVPADEEGGGALARLSGRPRQGGRGGTRGWAPLRVEFEVPEALARVELVLELRATTGTAWFARDTLRLERR